MPVFPVNSRWKGSLREGGEPRSPGPPLNSRFLITFQLRPDFQAQGV